MLITASWFETLRENLGIMAVSQVWGNKPAWYFWLADAAGVYHLTVENTETEKTDTATVHSAVLSIRYYPFDHREMYDRFSFEEQCYISSGFFDRTNTPYHEHRNRIPENLFHVAVIEYAFDQENTFARLTFESMNMIRLSCRHAVERSYPALDRRKRFEKGSIDRRIPGVAIAYPFFDLLLCLHAHTSKWRPCRVILSREPGFETVYAPSGEWISIDAPDIHISTMAVLFQAPETASNGVPPAGIIDPIQPEKATVILDRSFGCGHIHKSDLASPASTPLNRRWWTLAEAQYTSTLCSACGCA